jgi:hypothetical protein
MSPRWRKATWAIIIWTGLVPAGAGGWAGDPLTLVFAVWLVGFVVLSIWWFASRPQP